MNVFLTFLNNLFLTLIAILQSSVHHGYCFLFFYSLCFFPITSTVLHIIPLILQLSLSTCSVDPLNSLNLFSHISLNVFQSADLNFHLGILLILTDVTSNPILLIMGMLLSSSCTVNFLSFDSHKMAPI